MTSTKGDTWAKLFAKARARSDRALLEEFERKIDLAEQKRHSANLEAQEAIARAFGRPISNGKGQAK